MKKYTLFIYSVLYIFFLVGLILHTSTHPEIFGKYTVKYFVLILVLLICFIPSIKFLSYLLKPSRWPFGKKKKKQTKLPYRFIFLLVFLLLFVLAPIETYLRYIYKDYESNSYIYTQDSFHPFLQSQLSLQDNIHINSHGFRGDEISLKKSEKTFRIVVLGGSTVLNREVDFEDNAVRVLEKMLREKYPQRSIEVLNAGKDYYTSEHSLIQFLFKVREFQPDYVIMWHGINDLYASCTDNIYTHGDYKNDYSHQLGAVSQIVSSYFKPAPIFSVKVISFDFFMKAVQDNLFTDITLKLKKTALQKAIKEYRSNVNTVSIQDFPSLSAYKRNMVYLVDYVKQQNIPLLLGNQPNLYKDKLSTNEVSVLLSPTVVCKEGKRGYSIQSMRNGIGMFNKATKDVAEEREVSFIDLDSSVPKSLDYFLDNVHYTKKGNIKIAQTLYKYIVENDIIGE